MRGSPPRSGCFELRGSRPTSRAKAGRGIPTPNPPFASTGSDTRASAPCPLHSWGPTRSAYGSTPYAASGPLRMASRSARAGSSCGCALPEPDALVATGIPAGALDLVVRLDALAVGAVVVVVMDVPLTLHVLGRRRVIGIDLCHDQVPRSLLGFPGLGSLVGFNAGMAPRGAAPVWTAADAMAEAASTQTPLLGVLSPACDLLGTWRRRGCSAETSAPVSRASDQPGRWPTHGPDPHLFPGVLLGMDAVQHRHEDGIPRVAIGLRPRRALRRDALQPFEDHGLDPLLPGLVHAGLLVGRLRWLLILLGDRAAVCLRSCWPPAPAYRSLAGLLEERAHRQARVLGPLKEEGRSLPHSRAGDAAIAKRGVQFVLSGPVIPERESPVVLVLEQRGDRLRPAVPRLYERLQTGLRMVLGINEPEPLQPTHELGPSPTGHTVQVARVDPPGDTLFGHSDEQVGERLEGHVRWHDRRATTSSGCLLVHHRLRAVPLAGQRSGVRCHSTLRIGFNLWRWIWCGKEEAHESFAATGPSRRPNHRSKPHGAVGTDCDLGSRPGRTVSGCMGVPGERMGVRAAREPGPRHRAMAGRGRSGRGVDSGHAQDARGSHPGGREAARRSTAVRAVHGSDETARVRPEGRDRRRREARGGQEARGNGPLDRLRAFRLVRLPGQLGPRHSPAHRLREHQQEPAQIAPVALVEREGSLVEIPEQVERLDADVGALQAPLKERPEVLDAVRVDCPIDVLAGVIDDGMGVVAVEPAIRAQSIGVDVRAGEDVLPDEGLQGRASAVGDDLRLDAPATGENADDGDLVLAAGPGDPLAAAADVHVAGFAADERLVHFDVARCSLERARLHRQPNAVEHEPGGLLADAERPPEFIGADPVLRVGDQPDGGKPLFQRQRAVLEDRPELDGELALAGLAAPQSAGRDVRMFLAATTWADRAFRPSETSHERDARVGVREVDDRLAKRLWELPFRDLVHALNYRASALVCQGSYCRDQGPVRAGDGDRGRRGADRGCLAALPDVDGRAAPHGLDAGAGRGQLPDWAASNARPRSRSRSCL